MAGTTLQGTVLDRTPAVNMAAATRKAAVQKSAGKTQDFGDVLGKAAQVSRQVSRQVPEQTDKAGAGSAKADTEPANTETAAEKKSVEKDPVEKTSAEKNSVEKNSMEANEKSEKSAESVETGEKSDGTKNVSGEDAAAGQTKDAGQADEKIPGTELLPEVRPAVEKEAVDEITVEEIAAALEQIVGQIKQVLGITDEELLAGMEKAGMTEFDLLNPDNMKKLVTAISGNDSGISLVADEKLYAALKDISGMAEGKLNELLGRTGLTGDELEIVLEKLKEMESAKSVTAAPEQGQVLDSGPIENQADMEALPGDTGKVQEDAKLLTEGSQNMGKVQEGAKPLTEEPIVIIREDKAKPASQYDTTLPENQQENPVEAIAGTKTQDAHRGTDRDDGSEPGNFAQNNAQQNLRDSMGDVNGAAVAEGTAKFVSEGTENILRQLADMVKIVKNESLTEMELQLHPASLGTVNVSLATKGGAVTAHFTAQNEAVKAAIESQAAQLQAKLEEQGVKVEAVEVSVASHEMERNLDKGGRDRQQAEQENARRIQGSRRRSINLRSLEEGGELDADLSGDDAARIAMEMMTANGNSMDLLA